MIDPTPLVLFFNRLEPTWVLILMFFLCLFSIALLARKFGLYGLIGYYVFGTIVGNIQVLKGTKFFFFPEPIALGTLMYSSLFLCNALITNNYSQEVTKKIIYLSGVTFSLFTAFMIFTTGYHPLPESTDLLFKAHEGMSVLFTNMPSLILASIIAFITSERLTSITFIFLKKLPLNLHQKLLSFLSMSAGQTIDTCLFSILAWKVFAPTSYSWSTIFHTYILGVLIFRIIISGLFSLVFPFLNKMLIAGKKTG